MNTRIQRVEEYLFEYFDNRFEDIDLFYRSTHRDRQYGIYKLVEGPRIMDFLISLHANIEEHFYSKKLVPKKFGTPELLFSSLNAFKEYLEEQTPLLEGNLDGENTSYIITTSLSLKNELIEVIEQAKQIYDINDVIVPYQDLRFYLITKNFPLFIKTLKSILSSVSYAITKTKEGYHHSNMHLILKLLGFEIVSEELTNNGRIDSVIRFTDTIFILEVKFAIEKDESDQALMQIKEKGYAEKFFVEKKELFAIGLSFSEKERNINGYKVEQIE